GPVPPGPCEPGRPERGFSLPLRDGPRDVQPGESRRVRLGGQCRLRPRLRTCHRGGPSSGVSGDCNPGISTLESSGLTIQYRFTNPQQRMRSGACGLERLMKRRLNRKWLVILLAGTLLLGGGIHLLHGMQVRRNAGAILEQAKKLEDENRLGDAA